jgi:hypothetical protein
MTKEQQIEQYGVEVPEEYQGFVFGRNPPWDKEHFQSALAVAKSYKYKENTTEKVEQ